jgi:hypothetical protein
MDARRFETLYATYVKRKQAEKLENQEMLMMAAIWANSNYDDPEKNPRKHFVEQLEADAEKKLAKIYGIDTEPEEAEIDKDNPFWAAMYRGLEKMHGTAIPTKDEVDRAIADAKSPFGGAEIDQL